MTFFFVRCIPVSMRNVFIATFVHHSYEYWANISLYREINPSPWEILLVIKEVYFLSPWHLCLSSWDIFLVIWGMSHILSLASVISRRVCQWDRMSSVCLRHMSLLGTLPVTLLYVFLVVMRYIFLRHVCHCENETFCLSPLDVSGCHCYSVVVQLNLALFSSLPFLLLFMVVNWNIFTPSWVIT